MPTIPTPTRDIRVKPASTPTGRIIPTPTRDIQLPTEQLDFGSLSQSEIEANYVLLGDGNYISNDKWREFFGDLPAETAEEYRQIALTKGIDVLNDRIAKDRAEFEAANVKLGDDSWVEKSAFEQLPEDIQQVGRDKGLDAMNEAIEAKNEALAAQNAALLETIRQQQREAAEFGTSHIRLNIKDDKGDYLYMLKSDYDALTSSQQREVMTTGYFTPSPLQQFGEALQNGAVPAGSRYGGEVDPNDPTKGFYYTPPVYPIQIGDNTITETTSPYMQFAIALKYSMLPTDEGNIQYQGAVDPNDPTKGFRWEIVTGGTVDGKPELLEFTFAPTEMRQFIEDRLSGKIPADADFMGATETGYSYISPTMGKTEVVVPPMGLINYLEQFVEIEGQDGSTLYIDKSEYEAMPPEAQGIIGTQGIEGYNEWFRANNVKLNIQNEQGEDLYMPKVEFDALTSEQQQEVMAAGEYTIPISISPKEQFDQSLAAGDIPSDAVFVGAVDEDDPSLGFEYQSPSETIVEIEQVDGDKITFPQQEWDGLNEVEQFEAYLGRPPTMSEWQGYRLGQLVEGNMFMGQLLPGYTEHSYPWVSDGDVFMYYVIPGAGDLSGYLGRLTPEELSKPEAIQRTLEWAEGEWLTQYPDLKHEGYMATFLDRWGLPAFSGAFYPNFGVSEVTGQPYTAPPVTTTEKVMTGVNLALLSSPFWFPKLIKGIKTVKTKMTLASDIKLKTPQVKLRKPVKPSMEANIDPYLVEARANLKVAELTGDLKLINKARANLAKIEAIAEAQGYFRTPRTLRSPIELKLVNKLERTGLPRSYSKAAVDAGELATKMTKTSKKIAKPSSRGANQALVDSIAETYRLESVKAHRMGWFERNVQQRFDRLLGKETPDGMYYEVPEGKIELAKWSNTEVILHELTHHKIRLLLEANPSVAQKLVALNKRLPRGTTQNAFHELVAIEYVKRVGGAENAWYRAAILSELNSIGRKTGNPSLASQVDAMAMGFVDDYMRPTYISDIRAFDTSPFTQKNVQALLDPKLAAKTQKIQLESLAADKKFVAELSQLDSLTPEQIKLSEIATGYKGLGKALKKVQTANKALKKALANLEAGETGITAYTKAQQTVTSLKVEIADLKAMLKKAINEGDLVGAKRIYAQIQKANVRLSEARAVVDLYSGANTTSFQAINKARAKLADAMTELQDLLKPRHKPGIHTGWDRPISDLEAFIRGRKGTASATEVAGAAQRGYATGMKGRMGLREAVDDAYNRYKNALLDEERAIALEEYTALRKQLDYAETLLAEFKAAKLRGDPVPSGGIIGEVKRVLGTETVEGTVPRWELEYGGKKPLSPDVYKQQYDTMIEGWGRRGSWETPLSPEQTASLGSNIEAIATKARTKPSPIATQGELKLFDMLEYKVPTKAKATLKSTMSEVKPQGMRVPEIAPATEVRTPSTKVELGIGRTEGIKPQSALSEFLDTSPATEARMGTVSPQGTTIATPLVLPETGVERGAVVETPAVETDLAVQTNIVVAIGTQEGVKAITDGMTVEEINEAVRTATQNQVNLLTNIELRQKLLTNLDALVDAATKNAIIEATKIGIKPADVTKPTIKTQTKPATEAVTQTKTITPTSIGKGGKIIPPFILLPKADSVNAEKMEFPEGTYYWRMGAYWEILPPPYNKMLHSLKPPTFAKKFATGKGSSYATFDVYGRPAEKDIAVALGWANIYINNKGRIPTIKFSRNARAGTGVEGETQGEREAEALALPTAAETDIPPVEQEPMPESEPELEEIPEAEPVEPSVNGKILDDHDVVPDKVDLLGDEKIVDDHDVVPDKLNILGEDREINRTEQVLDEVLAEDLGRTLKEVETAGYKKEDEDVYPQYRRRNGGTPSLSNADITEEKDESLTSAEKRRRLLLKLKNRPRRRYDEEDTTRFYRGRPLRPSEQMVGDIR